jgi:hypothetical protein
LIHVPSGEFGIPLWPRDRGFTGSFRKLGDMISDVEPMALPSRNVGGKFVGKVSLVSLLSKLNASAPYNGWIFGGGLWLYPERKRKRSQWGSIPRKASQKWMKIAIWQIEFGLR